MNPPKLQWRMSPTTFFSLLTLALSPPLVNIVLFEKKEGRFYFLLAPIELDSKMQKGQLLLEAIEISETP